MNIDRELLETRAWAVPAISALLVLHNDFPAPRHANVKWLTWKDSTLTVRMEYGLRNLSGNVSNSADYTIALHQDGKLEVSLLKEQGEGQSDAVHEYLAGEMYREIARAKEYFQDWLVRDPEWLEHATLFSQVCAVVAHPFEAMALEVDKDPTNLALVRKIKLASDGLAIEITPSGAFGVNLFTKGFLSKADVHSIRQEVDMRPQQVPKPKFYDKLLELVR